MIDDVSIDCAMYSMNDDRLRRVYATMIDEWLGVADTAAIPKGRFEPLGAFA